MTVDPLFGDFIPETIDELCPLLDIESHVCRNRDGAARAAAGYPPLRPGSSCFEGANYTGMVQHAARHFTAHMADRLEALLAVMRCYGDDTGDYEIEFRQAAIALGLYRGAASLAEKTVR